MNIITQTINKTQTKRSDGLRAALPLLSSRRAIGDLDALLPSVGHRDAKKCVLQVICRFLPPCADSSENVGTHGGFLCLVFCLLDTLVQKLGVPALSLTKGGAKTGQ